MKSGGIAQLKKSSKNSPVWNDLLKTKHIYMKGRTMMIGNGKSTSFCYDAWCEQVSLKEKFPLNCLRFVDGCMRTCKIN